MSTTHRPSNVPRWLLRAALGTASALAILQVVGWLTSAPQVGRFRSADDRDAYEAAYREAFATMPTPTNTFDIPTSFGTVRAYEWSNPHSAGAPVVLLPGRGSGVPMWSDNLPSLLEHRTIYALDALGDAGLSAQSVPLTSTADQARWIDEALTGLDITRAHIVGHSFGASSGAALAVNRPDRIATLTLLEPAFVLGWPPLDVLAWAVPASLPFLPQSWRDAAIVRIAGEQPTDTDLDDPVVRMITRGGTGYFASLPTPRPLSDDQLRGLTMPVHVAIADGSPVTSGQRSIERAALIPDIESRIWPNTTHSLPMQVAEPLAAELADFWARHDT